MCIDLETEYSPNRKLVERESDTLPRRRARPKLDGEANTFLSYGATVSGVT